MTKEQLLMPRYKVIADYPDSDFNVGEILDRDWGWDGNDEEGFKKSISMYPHLFRKLEWWEERKIDDIGYILVNSDFHYGIAKPIKILGDAWGNDIVRLDGWKFDVQLKYCSPATEEEYLTFKNSNQ